MPNTADAYNSSASLHHSARLIAALLSAYAFTSADEYTTPDDGPPALFHRNEEANSHDVSREIEKM
jgi:hypothetical protein